jgi:hypothetical protein
VKALDFPILADENVHPEVIEFLRKTGLDVDSIAEQENFGGKSSRWESSFCELIRMQNRLSIYRKLL